MCGIAGILSLSSTLQAQTHRLDLMQTALQHRGPDDQGIFLSPDRQAAFAHTRLSILDLSSAGHQPMSTPNHRYWITFNGEIYNFEQLRQQLIAQGEQFNSHTDTEVILKLYQKMGADCVQHFRGMFALAIWDDLEKTCFLARDPLGIKPLYYWQSGSTLVFASELRAVLASGLPMVEMSSEGLYGYLLTGSVPEPYTLIAGIKCLTAGHTLKWQSGHVTQQQYWQIDFTPQHINAANASEKVRAAVIDSIQSHFVSDVPVGLFLSGGIDSTAVLALAQQTKPQQLRTFSIAFAETQWNEGEIARRAAEHFGAKHTEYKITAVAATELFPEFLKAIDQPSVDAFNTFCVSKVAHDHGMKVVLSGLGGDEIFGGYPSFQQIPQMLAWGKKLQAIPLISNSIGKGLAMWGNTSKLNRIGDFLQRPVNSATAYRSYRGVFTQAEAQIIAQQYLSDQSFPIYPNIPLNSNCGTLEDEVSYLELNCYMRNQLLRDSDVMSMNWGLELRTPLVDRVLLEAVASIPSQWRLAAGKQLLIQAVPELPHWIVNRPKQGFSFPFDQWMSSEFGDYFNGITIPENISLRSWSRRWSLSILGYWWKQITTQR
jgi:asparagine synthase (glutamine-hydrolysing)